MQVISPRPPGRLTLQRAVPSNSQKKKYPPVLSLTGVQVAKENERLHDANKSLEKEYTKALKKCEEQALTIKDLKATVSALYQSQLERNRLSKEISEMKLKASTRDTEVVSSVEEHNRLLDEVTELKKVLKQQEFTIDSEKQKVHILQKCHSNCYSTISQLQSIKARSRQEQIETDLELTKNQEIMKNQALELAQLKRDYDEVNKALLVSKEKNNNDDTIIKDQDNNIHNLMNQLEDHKLRSYELQVKRKKLMDENCDCQQQISKLTSKLNDLTDNYNTLSANMIKTKDQLHGIQDEATEGMRSLMKTTKELNKTNEKLTKSETKRNEIEKRYTELTMSHLDLKENYEQAVNKLRESTCQIEEHKIFQVSHQSCKSDIENLNKQVVALLQRVNISDKEQQELKTKLQSTILSLKKITNEHEPCTKTILKLQLELSETADQVSKYNMANQDVMEIQKTLTNKLAISNSEIERLRSASQSLMKRIEESKTLIKTGSVKIQALEKELNDEKTRHLMSQDLVKSLVANVKALQASQQQQQ